MTVFEKALGTLQRSPRLVDSRAHTSYATRPSANLVAALPLVFRLSRRV